MSEHKVGIYLEPAKRKVNVQVTPEATVGEVVQGMVTARRTTMHDSHIPLNRGTAAQVDAEDLEWLVSLCRWFCAKRGYAVRNLPRRFRDCEQKPTLYMHRLIWEHHFGPIPENYEIDHIDGDRLNNRKANLRLVTSHQNKMNSRLRSDNSSGFKGVTWSKDKRRWQAQIMKHGKNHVLGRFKTPEEAAEAYKDAALEMFGEYARFAKKESPSEP